MNIQWIVSPIVGCVIGYITNWVAIKMLFRPFEPKYIGSWHVPLTPGLIPKEKHRLAVSVGDVISSDLLNSDTVKSALASDEMLEKIGSGIDSFLESRRGDERTLRQLGQEMMGGEAFDDGAVGVRQMAVKLLVEKLGEANLGDMAAQAVVDHVKKKSPSALAGLVSGILDERIKQAVMSQLSEGVAHYLDEHGETMLDSALKGQEDKLLDSRISDIIERYDGKLPELKQKLLTWYRSLINVGTEKVLSTVDLSSIVQGRIEGLDDRELEGLIFGVISRELNAIVWFGAGLGFLMGFVNLLFM